MTDIEKQKLLHKNLVDSGLSTSKLNEAISSINNAASCGMDCKDRNNIASLKRAFNSAKINLKRAPDEVKSAEEAYIKASKGDAYYDKLMRERYNQMAQDIKKQKDAKRNEMLRDLRNLNSSYESETKYYNDIVIFKNDIIKENAKLMKEINDASTDIKTNHRKTYYERQQIEQINFWNNVIYVIYWLAVICYAMVALLYKKQHGNYKIWVNVIVFTLLPFLFMPFIYYVIELLGSFITFLWSYFPKHVDK